MPMADGYMTYPEYQAIMAENDWHESRAVKLYLNKAKQCHRRRLMVREAAEANPDNRALQVVYQELDDKRVENVWLAIETAQAEALQKWRYLEDGSKFVDALVQAYQGDTTQYSQLDKAKIDYIEILTKEEQRQIKNGDDNLGKKKKHY